MQNRQLPPRALTGIASLGFMLVLSVLMQMSNQGEHSKESDTSRQPAQATPGAPTSIEGRYVGAIRILGGVRGSYEFAEKWIPTANPTAAELVTLNFAAQLHQDTPDEVAGFIDPDFDMVHTIQGTARVTLSVPTPGPGTPSATPAPPVSIALGPALAGSIASGRLTLQSERVTDLLTAGRGIVISRGAPTPTVGPRTPTPTPMTEGSGAVNVDRVIYMVTTEQIGSGDVLSGDYYETIWRQSQEPLTVFGRFVMARPVTPTDFPTAGTPGAVTVTPTTVTVTPGTRTFTPTPVTATPGASGTPFTVAGKVILERRGSSAGARACVSANCTSSDAAGAFSLPNVRLGDTLEVTHPSYLRSQRPLTTGPGMPGGTVNVPDLNLLGGDVDQDGRIYDTDAGRIAGSWGQTRGGPRWLDSLDVNADGRISGPDMVAVQYNWAAQAPGAWAGAGLLRGPDAGGAASPAQGAPTRLSFRPTSAGVAVGQTADVEITVKDADALFLYNIRVEFDPRVLTVEDADPDATGVQVVVGDFLDMEHFLVVRNTVDNAAGIIELVVTEIHPGDGASGDGVLGRIRLSGLADGRSPLQFAEVRLFQDGFPDPIALAHQTVDGAVTVGIPTPAAVYLPRTLYRK